MHSFFTASVAGLVGLAGLVLGDDIVFDRAAYNAGQFGLVPNQTYRSTLTAGPLVLANTFVPRTADEAESGPYIFLAGPYGPNGEYGPVILSAADLSLVYADCTYEYSFSSDVQTLPDGSRVLVFWDGGTAVGVGYGRGRVRVYNEAYALLYNVTIWDDDGQDAADMNEAQLTQDGTMIMSFYHNTTMDTSSVEGGYPDMVVADSGFKEVDLDNGNVVFEWMAADHFVPTDTYARCNEDFGAGTTGWDWFHINSIQKMGTGDYLVSARQFSSVVLVSGETGEVLWILGGRHNQFEDLSDGQATNFGWQHDARILATTDSTLSLTMFDNYMEGTGSCGGDVECLSRGLELEIDVDAKTARLVKEYFHPEGINSGAMGGVQKRENGDTFVSWGINPTIVDYNGVTGDAMMDVQFGPIGDDFGMEIFSYRARVGKWEGRPPWGPNIAVEAYGDEVTAYISWNGATEVKKWAIISISYDGLFTDDPLPTQTISLVDMVGRDGFETEVTFSLDKRQQLLFAVGLDKNDKILGSTRVIEAESGTIVSDPPSVDFLDIVGGA